MVNWRSLVLLPMVCAGVAAVIWLFIVGKEGLAYLGAGFLIVLLMRRFGPTSPTKK
jgi:hypothetical protein